LSKEKNNLDKPALEDATVEVDDSQEAAALEAQRLARVAAQESAAGESASALPPSSQRGPESSPVPERVRASPSSLSSGEPLQDGDDFIPIPPPASPSHKSDPIDSSALLEEAKRRFKARQEIEANRDGIPAEQAYREVIVDKNGMPRQAGSDVQMGRAIRRMRKRAEESLYFFCKGILNRHFLTPALHKPVCEFLQTIPPFRKLVLMPREHAKTAIVSGGLPLHIIIQPAATNIYFPGLEGSECRIMLAGENLRMARKNLRVIESTHSENKLFRALWPHRVWEQPRRQSKAWNQDALIFPRDNEWPDPTLWALGVDGAVTGARPNVMIKDDLVSVEAANSDVVMDSAIEWHRVSRALLDTYEIESGMQSLEFIIGTRWAVFDLYSYIIDNDPSVAVIDEKFHKIIDGDRILWPEKHTKETIEQLRKEYGSMFYLLYLNSAADPELTDFDLDMIREARLLGDKLIFEEDERDERLRIRYKQRVGQDAPPISIKRGTRMTPDVMRTLALQGGRIRARSF
jgi:hypothetical protein